MKQYKNIGGKPELVKVQDEVLKFWADEKIFEKSVEKNSGTNGKGEMWSVDGPPFPTGTPHYGHLITSFLKDMIARFWTMNGYSVPRIWGWDCHGLPIEQQIEKKLGLKGKNDIEQKVGIPTFNDECKKYVSNINGVWADYVREMARWVDYDGAYRTMDVNFMESIIWAFKQCYEKGLIYEGYRVTPYCYHCETGLSISDARSDDSTRSKQDSWVIVKFKVVDGNQQPVFENGKPVHFLAWTTTPWTLPSNLGLAVGADMEYVYVDVGEEIYIAGKSAIENYKKIFGESPNIVKTVIGNDLVGKRYEPLLPYFSDKYNEGAFKVILADFVEEGEGIGIVHMAPAFGEDDFWACKNENIPMVCPVDARGIFTSEVTDFVGQDVLSANTPIIKHLHKEGKLVESGQLTHNYPHCWRCKNPLIYKAIDAWYFNIEKIKGELKAVNENVNWIPETIKTGRFGNWLENARDWNISRNRYWATPIPVWKCSKCDNVEVLGSLDEIEKRGGKRLTDLHRQYMDEVEFDCKCGGTMKRVEEVLDGWFESGAVPFASLHYPFENAEFFEKHATSDYLAEYVGQIRCWFYYLHVLSTALFGKPAFANCITHGTLLDKTGHKMSKSSGNYTDPMLWMKKYGTDACRLYLFNSNSMGIGDLVFEESDALLSLQQVIFPLWNAVSFYTSYANIDEFYPDTAEESTSSNQLDKWILARLYETENAMKNAFENYRVDEIAQPLAKFVDGLTNWYIRRSRRRFWASGFEQDKRDAYQTLYYVLLSATKIIAPLAPIMSENLYQVLVRDEKKSVHLENWPDISEKYKNDELIKQTEFIQKIVEIARNIRVTNSVKNRQPLSVVQIAFVNSDDKKIVERDKEIIAEELNVKAVEFIDNVDEIAEVIYKPNFNELKKYGADTGAIIQAIKSGKIQVLVDGTAVIDMNGVEKILTTSDLLIEYKAKSGKAVGSGGAMVVALDLNITEELKDEGKARDLVRLIQDERKNQNYNIMDEILIELDGDIPAVWRNYIFKETLGIESKVDNPDAIIKMESTDGEITAKIKRE